MSERDFEIPLFTIFGFDTYSSRQIRFQHRGAHVHAVTIPSYLIARRTLYRYSSRLSAWGSDLWGSKTSALSMFGGPLHSWQHFGTRASFGIRRVSSIRSNMYCKRFIS